MREWTSVTVTSNRQANEAIALFETLKPTVGAFDSETNGLHIVNNKPFMFQWGFLHPTERKGYTFLVDIERQPDLANQMITAWNKQAARLQLYLAHNVKFDLNMLINNGTEYTGNNLSDTQFYIRHAHDHRVRDKGGPDLRLKEYVSKYVIPTAKTHDKKIQSWRAEFASTLNRKLRTRLSTLPPPPNQHKYKTYTMAWLEAFLKDAVMSWRDFEDPRARQCYCDWLALDVPPQLQRMVELKGLVDADMVPYNMVPRSILNTYAHDDIIFVLELWEKLDPVIDLRGTREAINIENKLIRPILNMERVGFAVDKPYLEDAANAVNQYIRTQRNVLAELVGKPLKISQRKQIQEILEGYGYPLESTKDEFIEQLKQTLQRTQQNATVVQFIALVQELRTLEKWYATYIQRFQYDLQSSERLYTTIHQVGTVTGRVTSDFQQFPKKPIKTSEGAELFHPRKLVLAEHGTVYLDFSQIELRFQALYTILVGAPDLNLCRAYMPYKCVSPIYGEFDYHNPAHIKAWDQEWYFSEKPDVLWHPTDVHGVTTTAATGLHPGDEGFSSARSDIGKRTNFAKNYGAQLKRIWAMFPEKTEEEARRIDGAYYKAFPGVKKYHEYCYTRADQYPYTVNLYGIKCYGVAGHNLINMLVQGSAAYYLKFKIIELNEYAIAHGHKSRWQMQIHDELSWAWHPDDPPEIFFEYKRIMEDWVDGLVPIVAEMEATRTSWAAKKGISNVDELRLCFST